MVHGTGRKVETGKIIRADAMREPAVFAIHICA